MLFRTITTRFAAPLMQAAVVVLMWGPSARAQAPVGLENVGVEEHLGGRVPLDATFRDHEGRVVRLGDYFHEGRPVLLNLVYHSCPSLCSLVLTGTLAVLGQQSWTVGREFDVVTLSIDPRDTPAIAAEARQRTTGRYARPAARTGWHFLVPEQTRTEQDLLAAHGDDAQVRRVARAIGYRYQWVPRQRQYAHPGVIMLLTPDGRVARYLYGIEYSVNDVRLGLIEASEGRSVSTVERVYSYCFHYDPSAQGYSLVASHVMQVGGGLTVLFLGGFLALYWLRELRRRRGKTSGRGFAQPLAKEST